jgi:excisionase family DNA binding protein
MPNTSKIKGPSEASPPSVESTLLGRVLTTKEAASILRISLKLLLSYIASGELHATKMGRGWRILESDLQRFYESHRTLPSSNV